MKEKSLLALLGLSMTVLLGTDAQATPSVAPLQMSNIVYKGAFRVPKGKYGASTKTYSLASGGQSLGFNPKNNSLFILGHLDSEKMVLEMTIPPLVNSVNLGDLNTANVLQDSIDLTGGIGYDKLGAGNTVIVNGGRPGSLLVYNDKLIGNSWAYYDGSYQAVSSHFSANLDWTSGAGFQGYYRVGVSPLGDTSPNGGFVGGYMGTVPLEWQADFGGPVLTGLGGTPVNTRSSYGPSVSVFDPANLGVVDPVPATMLAGYPSSHMTLGHTTGNLIYNCTTEVRGVVFPEGSGSVLFFGRHGLGADNYGAGTKYTGQTTYGPGSNNISEAGRTATSVPNTCGSAVIAGADVCSYDPADSSKGVHGYPYAYRVWAYNAADLAKVKNGATNPATGLPYKPWDVVPYAVWDLPLPFSVSQARIDSATYDPATQRIFLAQEAADRPSMEPFPVIHVFEVQNIVAPDTTVPVIVTTSPATTSTVSGTVTVKVLANDNVGVDHVEYYLNDGASDKLLFTTNSFPYDYNWVSSSVVNGSYTIYAVAFDQAGNAGRSPDLALKVNNTAQVSQTADASKPTITAFGLPASSNVLKTGITSFSASDNVAVTGYLVTETATPVPSVSAAGWTASAPTSFTFSGAGVKTAYAWAKDAAGNLSNGLSATVTITLPDTAAPVLGSFTMPASATSLTVPVTALSATDNVGVTGYLVTESASAPAAGAAGWSATAPASFTFAGLGSRTAYGWAKDAAGNISAARAASVNLSDASAPTLTGFTMPASATSLTVPVASLSATDNVAVTGYLVTESASAPAAGAAGWSASAPASFTFAGYGARTAYAWAKDAAGNVSSNRNAAVAISDVAAPVVTSFTLPVAATSLNVSVTSFTATDNAAVTGYLITGNSSIPAASASGWSASAPSSFSFATAGQKVAYAWAKDAAGNVSGAGLASVTITLPDLAAPVVGAFVLPTTSRSTTVAVSNFSASDNVGVAGYLITESATPPAAGATGWSSSAPSSLSFSGSGSRTAYAWAKDAAGNVSVSSSALVVIDTTLPVISSIALNKSSSGVTIKSWANDNIGVVKMQVLVDGILQKEAAAGSISALWSVTYRGTHTVLVKAYDAVGNVRSQSVNFTK
jgi:hypothetical protein